MSSSWEFLEALDELDFELPLMNTETMPRKYSLPHCAAADLDYRKSLCEPSPNSLKRAKRS